MYHLGRVYAEDLSKAEASAHESGPKRCGGYSSKSYRSSDVSMYLYQHNPPHHTVSQSTPPYYAARRPLQADLKTSIDFDSTSLPAVSTQ
jgi:hypothetical protein